MRLPRVSPGLPGLGGWSEDPLWARFYDWSVEHPRAGGLVWATGLQSSLQRLYRATDEISEQAPGARVLDVPCGGGVALRGLRRGQDVEYVAVDVSQAMLDRTMRVARERGVESRVRPLLADVADLPMADEEVDLVISLTGLHCFPAPDRAVAEMTRVLRPEGVITGSALLNDTGVRFEPVRRVGRLAGLLGPGCTRDELVQWLTRGGVADVTLEVSGAIAYFRGVKRPLG